MNNANNNKRSFSCISIIVLMMVVAINVYAKNENKIIIPSKGLIGSWVTTHTCNNKEVYGLLDINKNSSTLKIISSYNMAVLEFEQSNNTGSKSIELIADKWLHKTDNRSGEFLSIDISANLDNTGLVINGKINGQPTCSNFTAYKYKHYGKRDIKKGKIKLRKPAGKGLKMPKIRIKFNGKNHNLFGNKSKTVDIEQCIVLYQWQSHNVARTIGNRQKFTLDTVVSNDNSMLNIFGKTYDNWSSDDATAYKKMFADCKKQLSKSAKTNVSKLLYAASNRSALKSLSTGLGKKKSTNRRTKRAKQTGYEKYTNAWLLNFYSIASARAVNAYVYLKVKNILKQKPKGKYTQTIKEINDGNGIMKFLTDTNKIAYIQQLGGSATTIAQVKSAKKNQNQKNKHKKTKARSRKKCGTGKCGDGKCGETKQVKNKIDRKKTAKTSIKSKSEKVKSLRSYPRNKNEPVKSTTTKFETIILSLNSKYYNKNLQTKNFEYFITNFPKQIFNVSEHFLTQLSFKKNDHGIYKVQEKIVNLSQKARRFNFKQGEVVSIGTFDINTSVYEGEKLSKVYNCSGWTKYSNMFSQSNNNPVVWFNKSLSNYCKVPSYHSFTCNYSCLKWGYKGDESHESAFIIGRSFADEVFNKL